MVSPPIVRGRTIARLCEGPDYMCIADGNKSARRDMTAKTPANSAISGGFSGSGRNETKGVGVSLPRFVEPAHRPSVLFRPVPRPPLPRCPRARCPGGAMRRASAAALTAAHRGSAGVSAASLPASVLAASCASSWSPRPALVWPWWSVWRWWWSRWPSQPQAFAWRPASGRPALARSPAAARGPRVSRCAGAAASAATNRGRRLQICRSLQDSSY